MAEKQVYTVQHTAIGANGPGGGPAYHEGDDFTAPDVDANVPGFETQELVDAHVNRLLELGAIAPKTSEVPVTVPIQSASIIRTQGSPESSGVLADEGVSQPGSGKKTPAQPEIQTENSK